MMSILTLQGIMRLHWLLHKAIWYKAGEFLSVYVMDSGGSISQDY